MANTKKCKKPSLFLYIFLNVLTLGLISLSMRTSPRCSKTTHEALEEIVQVAICVLGLLFLAAVLRVDKPSTQWLKKQLPLVEHFFTNLRLNLAKLQKQLSKLIYILPASINPINFQWHPSNSGKTGTTYVQHLKIVCEHVLPFMTSGQIWRLYKTPSEHLRNRNKKCAHEKRLVICGDALHEPSRPQSCPCVPRVALCFRRP